MSKITIGRGVVRRCDCGGGSSLPSTGTLTCGCVRCGIAAAIAFVVVVVVAAAAVLSVAASEDVNRKFCGQARKMRRYVTY